MNRYRILHLLLLRHPSVCKLDARLLVWPPRLVGLRHIHLSNTQPTTQLAYQQNRQINNPPTPPPTNTDPNDMNTSDCSGWTPQHFTHSLTHSFTQSIPFSHSRRIHPLTYRHPVAADHSLAVAYIEDHQTRSDYEGAEGSRAAVQSLRCAPRLQTSQAGRRKRNEAIREQMTLLQNNFKKLMSTKYRAKTLSPSA